MSSKPQTTTTQQNTQPWPDAQPALRDAITGAQNLYGNNIGYQPYGGQMQADLSSQSQNALNQTQQIAQIADISAEDCKAVEMAMTKCSTWLPGHDKAPAARAPSGAKLASSSATAKAWALPPRLTLSGERST